MKIEYKSKNSVKVGDRFNRLECLEYITSKKTVKYFAWLCDCGEIKLISGSSVKNGNAQSCGCLRREYYESMTKHGLEGTSIYMRWCAMIKRCNNPTDKDYKYYGARGIKVSKRWHDFRNFYADMGEPPHKLTLERTNNDGNYCKSNCKWATVSEQNRNKRRSRYE